MTCIYFGRIQALLVKLFILFFENVLLNYSRY